MEVKNGMKILRMSFMCILHIKLSYKIFTTVFIIPIPNIPLKEKTTLKMSSMIVYLWKYQTDGSTVRQRRE